MERPVRAKLEEMDDDNIDHFSKSLVQLMNLDSLESDAPQRYGVSPSSRYNSVVPRSAEKSLEECAKFPDNIKLKEDISIEDVVKEHVLHFLPAKSLYKFRAVSKKWDLWINNPFFSHKQAVHFKTISGLFFQLPAESPFFISLEPSSCGIPSTSLSFLPEPVDIRTSCNGLLCCRGRHGDQAYYICNPATKEWRMLPSPIYYHGPGTAIVLAFELSLLNFSAHYQLICAVTLPDVPVLMFEIYSSRSNTWRISETVCCEMDPLILNGDGFYMRGFAYWKTESGLVLAFHVNYEQYGIINLPACSGPTGALTEMHGNLCYLLPRKEQEEYTVEVYRDMNMNLKQVISLSSAVNRVDYQDGLFQTLSFVNDDTLILGFAGRIVAYHLSLHKMQLLLATAAGNTGVFRYLPYVNSLVTVADSVAA